MSFVPLTLNIIVCKQRAFYHNRHHYRYHHPNWYYYYYRLEASLYNIMSYETLVLTRCSQIIIIRNLQPS